MHSWCQVHFCLLACSQITSSIQLLWDPVRRRPPEHPCSKCSSRSGGMAVWCAVVCISVTEGIRKPKEVGTMSMCEVDARR